MDPFFMEINKSIFIIRKSAFYLNLSTAINFSDSPAPQCHHANDLNKRPEGDDE